MLDEFLPMKAPLQEPATALKHFVSLAGICYGHNEVLSGVA